MSEYFLHLFSINFHVRHHQYVWTRSIDADNHHQRLPKLHGLGRWCSVRIASGIRSGCRSAESFIFARCAQKRSCEENNVNTQHPPNRATTSSLMLMKGFGLVTLGLNDQVYPRGLMGSYKGYLEELLGEPFRGTTLGVQPWNPWACLGVYCEGYQGP